MLGKLQEGRQTIPHLQKRTVFNGSPSSLETQSDKPVISIQLLRPSPSEPLEEANHERLHLAAARDLHMQRHSYLCSLHHGWPSMPSRGSTRSAAGVFAWQRSATWPACPYQHKDWLGPILHVIYVCAWCTQSSNTIL